jgi:plastocyanin
MHIENIVAFASLLALLPACGGEAPNGKSESTTSSTDGAGGSDAAAEEGLHEAAGMVNGCTRASAKNLTGHASVTIHFPSPATTFRFSPACVRVSKGTHITWSGEFSVHPLQAGRVNASTGVATVSTTSPIHHETSGTHATFTFGKTGTFGYYCTRHYRLGMKGAVFVE